MIPVPDELVALRQAVSVSYDMRDGKWAANPRLLEQLVEAEAAWTRQLWQQREESEAA